MGKFAVPLTTSQYRNDPGHKYRVKYCDIVEHQGPALLKYHGDLLSYLLFLKLKYHSKLLRYLIPLATFINCGRKSVIALGPGTLSQNIFHVIYYFE